jgi:hypothetical protein
VSDNKNMWVMKLLFAAAAASVWGWECGVTSQWEQELAEQVESAEGQLTSDFLRAMTMSSIRIHVQYGDMSVLFSDQLTRIEKDMSNTIAFYAKILSIYPLAQNWVLPRASCASHAVPEDHQTTGLPNVDLVIYVSAVSNSSATYAARAGPCAFEGLGTPIAGIFEIVAEQYET